MPVLLTRCRVADLLGDPGLQDAMVEDGVDLSSVTLDFVDEVAV